MFDLFLMFVRYLSIAYFGQWAAAGLIDQSVADALVGATGTLVTILWGMYSSGYFERFGNWLRSKGWID